MLGLQPAEVGAVMAVDKLRAEWFWCDRWATSSAFLLPVGDRGVYREMLTAAWARGASLPNDHAAIQRATGISAAEWRRHWPAVEKYWRVEGDRLVNDTQVEIFREARQAHQRASDRGKKGAQASAQARAQAATQAEPKQEPKQEPPSPSPSQKPPAKNAGGGASGIASALIRSSLEREKALKFNAFVGVRLDVPHKLHGDFVRQLGGDEPDTKLRTWYAEVDTEIEISREAITPDVWKWLDARFKAWAPSVVVDPEWVKLEAWAKEGA